MIRGGERPGMQRGFVLAAVQVENGQMDGVVNAVMVRMSKRV